MEQTTEEVIGPASLIHGVTKQCGLCKIKGLPNQNKELFKLLFYYRNNGIIP